MAANHPQGVPLFHITNAAVNATVTIQFQFFGGRAPADPNVPDGSHPVVPDQHAPDNRVLNRRALSQRIRRQQRREEAANGNGGQQRENGNGGQQQANGNGGQQEENGTVPEVEDQEGYPTMEEIGRALEE